MIIMETNTVPYETVMQLLEWSPTVVVMEQAVPQVLSWGIKIDVVIAAEAKIQELTQSLQDQIPLKFISCSESEELSTALYFLIAAKQRAVNIVSDLPLEHFESFPAINISVVQGGKRWSFIPSGFYEKWLPKGSLLSVFPEEGDGRRMAETDGILSVNRRKSFWVSED